MKPGYYFSKDDQLHYISDDINPRALSRICDRVLNDRVGYNFTVLYFHGYSNDKLRTPQWANNTFCEQFLDAALGYEN